MSLPPRRLLRQARPIPQASSGTAVNPALQQESEDLYAIGDIQGCLPSLLELLKKIPADAQLLFLGDLVNRGPQSLETLRFVKSLGDRALVILGNHDMHLLAVAAEAGEAHRKDTIQDVLAAPDRKELISWLRQQPLLIERAGVLFAHAGIHPLWDLETARMLAGEAHEALAGKHWKKWLQGMYGNTQWSPDLTGEKRMRAILNGFTRLRFVNAETGELDFDIKEGAGAAPQGWIPWFDYARRPLADHTICFGHWSMLGLVNRPNLVAIDTGCLWGGELTAAHFPERTFTQIKCPLWADPLAYSKKASRQEKNAEAEKHEKHEKDKKRKS